MFGLGTSAIMRWKNSHLTARKRRAAEEKEKGRTKNSIRTCVSLEARAFIRVHPSASEDGLGRDMIMLAVREVGGSGTALTSVVCAPSIWLMGLL
jgi:hypothetical protein